MFLKVLLRSRYSNQAGKIKPQKNHRLCGLFGCQLKGTEVERDICALNKPRKQALFSAPLLMKTLRLREFK